eukprot:SAG11_NODE_2601_length_3182_cov_2.460590_1_plen_63_part_10
MIMPIRRKPSVGSMAPDDRFQILGTVGYTLHHLGIYHCFSNKLSQITKVYCKTCFGLGLAIIS